MNKNIVLCLLILLCSNKSYAMTIPSVNQVVGIAVCCVVARYVTCWIAEYCAKNAIEQENYTYLKILKFVFPFLFKKGNIISQTLKRLHSSKETLTFFLIDSGTYVEPAVLLRACQ